MSKRNHSRSAAPYAKGYSEAGASVTRRALKGFTPDSGSPNEDINRNNATLRQRSRMLYMASPVATSAINTNRTKVVGTGLTLKATVDRDLLGLSPEAAKEWQHKAEMEFRLWGGKKQNCDALGLNNFMALQQLALKSWLMSGDVFVLVKRYPAAPLNPYSMRLHVIEADRVSTPTNFSGGYTYGGFMDLGAMPSTIDFQGPNGATFYRATQVSYTYKGLKNFRFNASVEVPAVDGTTNSELDIAQQRMPDFTAYAQYGWNSKSHVRVGGLIRSMTYTSTLSDKAHAVTGFGIQASTTFNLGKQWQVFGQATYGKGIGQYLNDLSNLNVDIVPNPDEAGKMQALPMLGWYAGLQYNISPKVFLSSTYSMSRLYSENGYPANEPSTYRYGQYFVANLFWNVTPNMQVGAEYLRGWRTNFDNSTNHANRMNLLVQYSF